MEKDSGERRINVFYSKGFSDGDGACSCVCRVNAINVCRNVLE